MSLKSEHASPLQLISDMHMGDVTARRLVFAVTELTVMTMQPALTRRGTVLSGIIFCLH